MRKSARAAAALAVASLAAGSAQAQEHSDADLANKLANPVANLISVPFQGNYDCCTGPSDGGRYTLNIQPVVPVELTTDWNMIVRTIVPVIHQEHTTPGDGGHTGLGDITQSFFFSPVKPVAGMVVAVGPAILWPTGSSELGSKKWGAGPTALVLKQEHGLTMGVLANHIWSFADVGDHDRPQVNSTFVQPFLSWTSPKATTLSITSEASYDWERKEWSIPVILTISQLYRFGNQRVSLGGGPRVYAARNGSGPDWGLRVFATLLFPK